ncbi:hypothetical protein TrRE_jg6879, partial [Triparma retinervis]
KIADRFVRWDAVHYLRKAQGLRAPSKCSSSSQVKPPAQPPSAGGEGPPQGTYEANDIQGAKRDEGGTLTETKLQETFQSEAHPSCPEIEYNETLIAFYPFYPSLINSTTLNFATGAYLLNPASVFFSVPSTESITLLLMLSFHVLHQVYLAPSLPLGVPRISLLPLLTLSIHLASSIRSTTGPLIAVHLCANLYLKPNLPNLAALALGLPASVLPTLTVNLSNLIEACGLSRLSTLGMCLGVDVPVLVRALNLLSPPSLSAGAWEGLLVAARQRSAYKIAQKTYWDTGYPLGYWRTRNLPHFALAAPAVYFVARYSSEFVATRIWKGGLARTAAELWNHKPSDCGEDSDTARGPAPHRAVAGAAERGRDEGGEREGDKIFIMAWATAYAVGGGIAWFAYLPFV